MIFDSIQNKENYKERQENLSGIMLFGRNKKMGRSISGYRNSERSHSGEPSIIC